ncbi:unnamed protein product [Gulo gulo]|uniref:Uncharacterized protein n=1 Tax=Gulo gulo TaxID=48420 RepID=A0A9X9LUM8_GULGU|nr:unnamed protein product [Gulo gulo]
MNSILTRGPAYGWALQGHSVEDSPGKGTDPAGRSWTWDEVTSPQEGSKARAWSARPIMDYPLPCVA